MFLVYVKIYAASYTHKHTLELSSTLSSSSIGVSRHPDNEEAYSSEGDVYPDKSHPDK